MLVALIASLAVLGGGVFAYASLIERNWYALRTHRVPCLPPGAEPVRILHISDLHLRAGQRRKRRWLRALARTAPDIVVGTGDFLGDDRPETVDAVADAVGAYAPSIAAVFVLGSNDYYSPKPKNPLRYLRRSDKPFTPGIENNWEALVERLRGAGWTALNNDVARFGAVEVVGQDDAHAGRADESVITPRAGSGSGSGVRLAVAHSPDSAPALAAAGFDLILCGHTHGGQVCVPGYGALITNCTLPTSMASGLHPYEGTWLHVSAGLGTSMYAPYRLACRPEACVLDLVPRGS